MGIGMLRPRGPRRRSVLAWACVIMAIALVLGLAAEAMSPPAPQAPAAPAIVFQQAPLAPPEPYEPHPQGGYIPPAVDLSHFHASWDGPAPAATLSRFDWRTQGKVTAVKDQGPCGACYAFASIGAFESKLLIDNAGTWDFSENNAKECDWYAGSCGGGNYFRMASFFSQAGTVLESCDPYVPSDVPCTTGCAYQKTWLDWRIISGAAIPDTTVLKNYIATYGPVMTTLYVGSSNNAWQQEFSAYDGSYTLYYTGSGNPNHGVLIVGWDDSLPHAGGTGGWIVKNSWGTNWGGTCGFGSERGYFTIAYGSAKIGYNSAFVYDWQDYDPNGDILYYDEAGWQGSAWGAGSTTFWGLARFYPPDDTQVARVEFWTTDKTTDVDVYLYGDFNGTTLSNLLAQKLNNAFNEPGYHSVALDVPVPVSGGDDVIAVVKFTNQSYQYPVAADRDGPHQTGRTYISANGTSWVDLGVQHSQDVAIRIRTSSGAAATATPTATPTPTSTRTRTPTPTPTPTRTVTRTATPTRTATRTGTGTVTATPRPTNTPGPSPTWVPGAQARLWLPIVFRQWNAPAPPSSTPTATRTRTATRTPTSTPTATPGGIPPGLHVLDNHSHYVDSANWLHIVGEVFNNTGDDLWLVDVPVVFYDGRGRVITADSGGTLLEDLPAGETTCFHAMLENPAGWAYYEFGKPSGLLDGEQWPHLTFLTHSGAVDDFGWYHVTGQVRNDHGSTVEWVHTAGTLYNAQGIVVGCEEAFTDPIDLGPSEVGVFDILFVGRDYSDVASYKLQADGEPQ